MKPPDYFASIHREACDTWQTLDEKPELAGPWHHLFIQVQSSRHVVSELLQNADDAGASEARVGITESGAFVFEHDGADFTAKQFQSLCRFGYSNKRSLFTIGFRGIGFKSTFSLGTPVSVNTPTLSVEFHARRFTEPVWVGEAVDVGSHTRISVRISDEHRRSEIERNLTEWGKAPVSLLFFTHIRSLHIGNEEFRWHFVNDGPAPKSRRMELAGNGKKSSVIVFRSAEEEFPPEALREIYEERALIKRWEEGFPPCAVELVLGAGSGFFVVLPSGGQTGLPFCANAPFILTPDRKHIKLPADSDTNRWLLDRVGALAAEAMLAWLANENLTPEERAKAYDLMPVPGAATAGSEDEQHGNLVKEAFACAIKGRDVLLTDDGRVIGSDEAVHLPRIALETWGAEQTCAFLDSEGKPALSRHISPDNLNKLVRRSLVRKIETKDFLQRLSQGRPPRPDGWNKLAALWSFVRDEYEMEHRSRWLPELSALHIVPCAGAGGLHQADGVVRVASKPERLRSTSDWDFLTARLLMVDPAWLAYLKEAGGSGDGEAKESSSGPPAVLELLSKLGLAQGAGAARMIDGVADTLVRRPDTTAGDWIRLAHIAAALKADVGRRFRFVTRDGKVREIQDGVFYDPDGSLEEILPDDSVRACLLHHDYEGGFSSCTAPEWRNWLEHCDTGLVALPAIIEHRAELSKSEFEDRIRQRQDTQSIKYRYESGPAYKRQKFVIIDFDFPEGLVTHWHNMMDRNPWEIVVTRLAMGNADCWKGKLKLQGKQTRTDGQTVHDKYGIKPVDGIHAPSAWVRRLRETACLPDTHGNLCVPSDLLRRTPATEPFMGVERFVDARLDTAFASDLLDALGVGARPLGPDRLIGALEALTHAPHPPRHELEKWYRRLDQFTADCSTGNLAAIRSRFAENKWVFGADGEWHLAGLIYQDTGSEDIPGVPLVLENLRDLRLWGRLGVPEKPTAELILQWIMSLPSGEAPDAGADKPLRAMMARYPARIWRETGHWLDLTGRWVPVDRFDHGLTDSAFPFATLHNWVKQRVADLRRLSREAASDPPFSGLTPLEAALTEQPSFDGEQAGPPQPLPWLVAFGEALARIELDDPAKTENVRETGARMTRLSLRLADTIRVTSYFEGKPAGTERRQDVAWVGDTVFVTDVGSGKRAGLLLDYLGRVLPDDRLLRGALCYACERPDEQILRYMEENFTLAPLSPPPAESETDSTRPPEPQPADTSPTPVPPEDTAPNGDTPPPPAPPKPEGDPPPPEPPRSGKPPQPSLIERFASRLGFVRQGDRFIHPDGSSIVRLTDGGGFPWCLRDFATGLERRLRPVDVCLEHRPGIVTHEVWSAVERDPGMHSLVVLATDGSPVEAKGTELLRLRKDGLVSLDPAAYRIKHHT